MITAESKQQQVKGRRENCDFHRNGLAVPTGAAMLLSLTLMYSVVSVVQEEDHRAVSHDRVSVSVGKTTVSVAHWCV